MKLLHVGAAAPPACYILLLLSISRLWFRVRGRALSADLGPVVHCDLTLCVASLRRMIGFTHFSLCFSNITWKLAV